MESIKQITDRYSTQIKKYNSAGAIHRENTYTERNRTAKV